MMSEFALKHTGKEKIEESYIISLEYDIDEDRFYYIDDKKCIPTKKDLSRSILMIYEIYERYNCTEVWRNICCRYG